MTNSLTSALIALVFLFFILRLLTGAKLPTHIGRPRTADGSGRGPALPRLRSGDSRASAGVFAVAAAAWSIAEGTSVVHSETPKVAALAGLAIGLMWVWPGVRWWLGAIFGVLGTLASVGSMFSFHPLGQGGLCELDEPDATWPIFLVIIVAMGMGALPMLRRIGLTGIRPVPGAREGRGLQGLAFYPLAACIVCEIAIFLAAPLGLSVWGVDSGQRLTVSLVTAVFLGAVLAYGGFLLLDLAAAVILAGQLLAANMLAAACPGSSDILTFVVVLAICFLVARWVGLRMMSIR